MNNIAIIPARGGSKRIPRKNIKPFLGTPIIQYSIEAAKKSKLFNEIMVSTDDNEIAELSCKLGANIPFLRSTESSNDYASTITVINEVLNMYDSMFNKKFDYACCIYPTAPLIQLTQLVKGYNQISTNKFATVFPVVPFSYPIGRALIITPTGSAKMLWPSYKTTRSQDLAQTFHDAGQWYWLNLQHKVLNLISENSAVIVLSEMEAQDIDNIIDWHLAELKYNMINEKKDFSKS
jgi:N-acylneuraminate cytidylyltransferase